MIDPYNFEDENFDYDAEELFPQKRISQMTEGEKLQRFKRFFDSSSRAILQDCLFRILNHEDGTGTLQILCPNEVVQQRLGKKNAKSPITLTLAGTTLNGLHYVLSRTVKYIVKLLT
ncbi:hypothetical protein [Tolypothrix sp. PCC 7910]|uniref:hypothetical protein n=1 Tax=Tolypothrix sp. PCC 7910 TaxID=2099387 RepID=UPI001FCB40A0|nr:hypothetical protein [Tolypothrix sp. PCC 7910]